MLDGVFSPQNIQKAYSRVAWFYDGWAVLTENKAHKLAIEYARIKQGDKILEVAVGTGRFLQQAFKQNEKGLNVGIDLSPSMLNQARRRLHKGEGQHVYFILGSANALPFADSQFDLIVCNFMFDLLAEIEFVPVLQEFKRVLSRPGRVVIAYMAHGHKSVNQFWHWLARRFPELLTGCRPISLKDYLTEAGFQKVRIQPVSQNTFPSEVLQAEV